MPVSQYRCMMMHVRWTSDLEWLTACLLAGILVTNIATRTHGTRTCSYMHVVLMGWRTAGFNKQSSMYV